MAVSTVHYQCQDIRLDTSSLWSWMMTSVQLSALHITTSGMVPQTLILQGSRTQTPALCSAVGYATAFPTAARRSWWIPVSITGGVRALRMQLLKVQVNRFGNLAKTMQTNNSRFAGHLCDWYKSDEYCSVQGNLQIHDRWAPTPFQCSSESWCLNRLDLIQLSSASSMPGRRWNQCKIFCHSQCKEK